MAKREGCKALRYFDQYQCPKCNKCWDVDDDEPPECDLPAPPVTPQFKETMRQRQATMLAELRREIQEKK